MSAREEIVDPTVEQTELRGIYAGDEIVSSMVNEVLRDEEFHIGWIAKTLERWRSEGLEELIDDAIYRGRRALARARDEGIRSQIDATLAPSAA